jgi:hypothetical protein
VANTGRTETHGTVAWVKVNSLPTGDIGSFGVSPTGGGRQELFLIWFAAILPDTPSVTQRMLWTAQLALVRDALVAKIPIIVTHGVNSPFADTVQIGEA